MCVEFSLPCSIRSNPEENKEMEGKGEQHPKKKDIEKSKGSGHPYYF